MYTKNFLLVLIGGICAWMPASAETPYHRGVQITDVIIFDDWAGVPPLSEGTIECLGGELEWIDPVTPVCAATGRLHIRNTVILGCAESPTDSRLSGVEVVSVNGLLDANYAGPVWGTWMTVPYNGCDPLVPVDSAVLEDPPVYWKGVWWGWRSQYCEGGQCLWLGDLKLIGKGHGGDIDRIRFRGREVVTTYTPFPVPWEFLPPELGLPGGPEGVITGRIWERTRWKK